MIWHVLTLVVCGGLVVSILGNVVQFLAAERLRREVMANKLAWLALTRLRKAAESSPAGIDGDGDNLAAIIKQAQTEAFSDGR